LMSDGERRVAAFCRPVFQRFSSVIE